MNRNVILLIALVVTIYMLISAVVALFHFNPIGFIIDLILAGAAAYVGWTNYTKP